MSETATPLQAPPPPPAPPGTPEPASGWQITPHGLVPDGATAFGLTDSGLVQWYLPEDAGEGGDAEGGEEGGEEPET